MSSCLLIFSCFAVSEAYVCLNYWIFFVKFFGFDKVALGVFEVSLFAVALAASEIDLVPVNLNSQLVRFPYVRKKLGFV